MAKNHDIVELDCKVLMRTDKAVMVENLKGENVWLPLSQVEVDDTGIQVPQWLAEEKELV